MTPPPSFAPQRPAVSQVFVPPSPPPSFRPRQEDFMDFPVPAYQPVEQVQGRGGFSRPERSLDTERFQQRQGRMPEAPKANLPQFRPPQSLKKQFELPPMGQVETPNPMTWGQKTRRFEPLMTTGW